MGAGHETGARNCNCVVKPISNERMPSARHCKKLPDNGMTREVQHTPSGKAQKSLRTAGLMVARGREVKKGEAGCRRFKLRAFHEAKILKSKMQRTCQGKNQSFWFSNARRLQQWKICPFLCYSPNRAHSLYLKPCAENEVPQQPGGLPPMARLREPEGSHSLSTNAQ